MSTQLSQSCATGIQKKAILIWTFFYISWTAHRKKFYFSYLDNIVLVLL